MNIYVVKCQDAPRKVFRACMVTENLEAAKNAKEGRRRPYIVTWRDGRVVSVEEPLAP